MRTKFLSRSALKWIALVTMLIDHIGAIFGAQFYQSLGLYWLYVVLRIVGRLSFPIFAFFIAEGWYYTKNKKRYALLLVIFAVISQPIYYFALNQFTFEFNILFTFLISIALMCILDMARKYPNYSFMYYTFMFAIGFIVFALLLMGLSISYGVYGVFLPVVFYAYNHSEKKYAKVVMWLVSLLLMVAYWLLWFLLSDMAQISSYISLFSVLSLPLLMCYNGQKGKCNLKYVFYIFYPLHILVLLSIKLII